MARGSGEATFDVGSAYAWRGQRLSRGPVAQWLVSGEYRDLADAARWAFRGEAPQGEAAWNRRAAEGDRRSLPIVG